jgi:signal transduction histidine kinase
VAIGSGDDIPFAGEENPDAGRSEVPPAAVGEAIAEERARIARELHDSVDKSLHGIALAAASLAAQHGSADPQSSRQRLRELAGLARYTISETRCVIYDLRDDNVRAPLGSVVRNVATVWGRSTGVAVSLAVAPDADAGNEYRREIVAILREALRNVEMHAHSTRVRVSLRRGERLLLTVTDNGHGFPFPADPRELQDAGHYGLIGMTERARKLGGTLVIRSRPGHGTRIAVQVPAAAADTAG